MECLMQKLLSVAILTMALLGGTAQAHHGFTGRYDTDKPYQIVGRVVAVSASPPHPTVTITVESAAMEAPDGNERPSEITGPLIALDAALTGQSVTIEFPPVATFYALGDRIKVGDRVEIIALRNCRTPHQLRSQWIRLPQTREIVKRDGRLSYMARGCVEG
jgi:hypothetical protein